MYQKDDSIVGRTNIQTDVVVINQCDEEKVAERFFVNNKGRKCRVRFICTRERGLSRSRNMAIIYATQPICLICDDDELLENDYEDKIIRAYTEHLEMDSILFMIERRDRDFPKAYPQIEGLVGLKQILQSSSVQITFRHNPVRQHGITFDTMLGSGSGNGGGEENKFLMDIRKHRLKIYYVPVNIGAVLTGNSQWFSGFTVQYMRNKGWSFRRSLGNFLGFLYTIFFWGRHIKLIRKELPGIKGLFYLMQGYFERREE
jgi:glycosyltransferase involved in cell wall biosynthesis